LDFLGVILLNPPTQSTRRVVPNVQLVRRSRFLGVAATGHLPSRVHNARPGDILRPEAGQPGAAMQRTTAAAGELRRLQHDPPQLGSCGVFNMIPYRASHPAKGNQMGPETECP